MSINLIRIGTPSMKNGWNDLLTGKLAFACSDQLPLQCLYLCLSGFKKPPNLELMGQ